MSDLPDKIKPLWGKRITVFSAAIGLQDHPMAEGVVIGYLPEPSVLIRHDDGTQSSWGISLPMKAVEPGGERNDEGHG